MRRITLLLPLTLALACGDKDSVDSGDVDADGDGVSVLEDCDDDDAEAFPGNTESCDGIDNDCNGLVDDGVKVMFYGDSDGDGFGDVNDAEEGCAPWGEYIEDSTDCDDTSDVIYPGAPEDDCTDPVDYNCDGSVQYDDADGDSFAACVDCDDNNSTINPDATEECDFLDNNCDGTVDESGSTALTFYADTDEDGFGDAANTTESCHAAPPGYVGDDTDCDDANGATYPGAPEICDAADNDCDQVIGEALVPTDYASIQEGVESGEAWVCIEAGTYTENVVIDLTSDFTLHGVGSDQVIIDGGGADRTLVATDNSGLTMGGFTIQNGYVEGDFGGGLYIVGGTVTLDDVIATGNTGSGFTFGHAIAVVGADEFTGTNLEVHANDADGNGETTYGPLALYNNDSASLDGVSVHSHSLDGDVFAVGLVTFTNNSVTLNDIDVSGNEHTDAAEGISLAAMLGYYDNDVDISNVTVTENTMAPDFSYGALAVLAYEDVTGSHLDVRANQIDLLEYGTCYTPGATVSSDGSVAVLSNVIIAGNTCTGDENTEAYLSGLIALGTSSITNATLHGNEAAAETNYYGGVYGGDLTLVNISLTSNTGGPAALDLDSSAMVASYSNVYGNDVDFTTTDPTGTDGNVSVDPGYTDVSSTDPMDWDLTLATGSDLIDAGDPTILDTDGSTSDIGATGGPDADW